MAYKVFISYHHGKASPLAKRLYNTLTARGISTFRDEESIAPGESIPRAIRLAIRNCRFLICIVTKDWLTSEWTNMELDNIISSLNRGNEKIIIPLIIESDMYIPDDIAQYRGLDFSDWETNYDVRVTDLLRSISSTNDFFKRQNEIILNSTALPWISLDSVSFDYVWSHLFINSSIICFKHNASTTISQWLDGAQFNRNTLIIGEPGVGKSTMMKYAVINYGKQFNIFYTTARQLSEIPIEANSNYLQSLLQSSDAYQNSNMNINLFRCFFIDALDEAGPYNIDKLFSICRILNNMDIATYLSSRMDFYLRYIQNNARRYQLFYEVIQIQEWSAKQSIDFARKFLTYNGNTSVSDDFIELIRNNEHIRSLIKNPFRLSLILFLYQNSAYHTNCDISNIYVLYKEFYSYWLLQERRKKTSHLKSVYIEELHKHLSLELFRNRTSVPLSMIQRDDSASLEEIQNDTGVTGLLQMDNTDEIAVVHKFCHETLSEFLLAKLIVDSFINASEQTLQLMSTVFDNSINLFVRACFDAMPYHLLVTITNNLSELYKTLFTDKCSSAISSNERIREQLLYYLGRLPINYIPEVLEYAYHHENNSILMRSAALSLILKGDEDVEREYLELVQTNKRFNVENRSIQLVYFGDVDSDLHTYRDNYLVPWNRTREALIARFRCCSLRDIRLRLWDLITFKSFIESRGTADISEADFDAIDNCQVDSPYNSNERSMLLRDTKDSLIKMITNDRK